MRSHSYLLLISLQIVIDISEQQKTSYFSEATYADTIEKVCKYANHLPFNFSLSSLILVMEIGLNFIFFHQFYKQKIIMIIKLN